MQIASWTAECFRADGSGNWKLWHLWPRVPSRSLHPSAAHPANLPKLGSSGEPFRSQQARETGAGQQPFNAIC